MFFSILYDIFIHARKNLKLKILTVAFLKLRCKVILCTLHWDPVDQHYSDHTNTEEPHQNHEKMQENFTWLERGLKNS